METLKFKTNINCGGCVAKLTPVLNGLDGVEQWEVDTISKNKILTIRANENVTADQILQAVTSAGFQSEKI